MDNLEKDVREAMRLGYGCHYGHCKAAYPYTADHSVDKCPESEAPPVEEPRLCRCCGKEFPARKGYVNYCSDFCKKIGTQRKNTEWHRRSNSKPKEAACAFCGKIFQRVHGGQKYCSRTCCQRAAYRRKKV